MAYEFRLPDIGEGVVEGEVVRWLVKEGERIVEDQPMVEVMTDKATVEIPSPRGGVVEKIFVAAGTMCKVGQAMLAIDEGQTARQTGAGKTAPVQQSAGNGHAQVAAPTASATASGTGSAPSSPTRALAAPAVRRRAREAGIDLDQVSGSGPAGRVMAEDIERFVEGRGQVRGHTNPAHPAHIRPPAAPRPPGNQTDERIPLRGLRKAIAEKMALSKRTAAHFTYVEECDVTELVNLRSEAQRQSKVKLTYLPFVLKAVIAALREYPMCNAWLDEERGDVVYRRQYHIGVAAATAAGLTVPVVRDADQRSLFGLATEIDRLALAVRENKATRDELTGSTFTVTSLGALGGLMATPIINFPEVAILGVHAFREQPRVVKGQIVIRTVGNLSVSFDHRVVDGMEGAMFLQAVCRRLASPGLLLLEEGSA